jgi:hypothetical protein
MRRGRILGERFNRYQIECAHLAFYLELQQPRRPQGF